MKAFDTHTIRRMKVALAVLCCFWLGACAVTEPFTDSVNADVLIGTWKVDLRPTPESAPYYKEFIVTSVEGNSFSGTFYDAEISQARINTDWGKLRIAFTTVDGSGPYHHSAVLEGSRLEGLTNSTGRDFLSYWTALKQ